MLPESKETVQSLSSLASNDSIPASGSEMTWLDGVCLMKYASLTRYKGRASIPLRSSLPPLSGPSYHIFISPLIS